jgi:hypothetical protein
MASRAKWLFCAFTCLAALLTAATFAQAQVDQSAKNGCQSPQAYSGAITTPDTEVPVSPNSAIRFQAWFEVESIAPAAFDRMTVEYSLAPAQPGDPRDWIAFGDLTDPTQVQPNTNSRADLPYSNQGTSVTPGFQLFTFLVPVEAQGQLTAQFRIRFDTGDATYQGFRGLGVDAVDIDRVGGNLQAGFEGGQVPSGWTFDPPSGPGGPFWQVLTNPQNVSVKNPQINPDLVTLPDSGALPAAFAGSGVAWFGNVDSGTFCGPDFANRFSFLDTFIASGPPASTPSKDASFSFSGLGAASFQCQLDGGAFAACASPQSYSGLSNGAHTFAVRALDSAGSPDPTPATYIWTIREATLEDLDNPTYGVDVNVDQVSGTVRVGIPSRSAAAGARGSARASQKGITFVPLSEARQIPVGSFLDTRKGTVRLQSAKNSTGARQSGTFLNSLFQVRQSKKRSARGLTDLILKGSSFSRCRTGRGKAAAAQLSRRTIRRLRANARGRFRTSGRNSSATVRGTVWDVTDRCDGTLTKVRRGRVVVRDFRRKKNITLTSGKSYLARAPR